MRILHAAVFLSAVLFSGLACSTDPAREHPLFYEGSVTDTLRARPLDVSRAIVSALEGSGYKVHRQSFLYLGEPVSLRTLDNEPTWAGTVGFDPMGNERRRSIPVRVNRRTGFGVDPPQLFVLVLLYPVEIAPNRVELKISTKAWKYFPERGEGTRTPTDATACTLLLQEIKARLRK